MSTSKTPQELDIDSNDNNHDPGTSTGMPRPPPMVELEAKRAVSARYHQLELTNIPSCIPDDMRTYLSNVRIATQSTHGQFRLHDCSSNKVTHQLTLQQQDFYGAAYIHGGSNTLAYVRHGVLEIWNMSTDTSVTADGIYLESTFIFSHDGSKLVIVFQSPGLVFENNMAVVLTSTAQQLWVNAGILSASQTCNVCFSADNSKVLLGSTSQRRLTVHDSDSGAIINLMTEIPTALITTNIHGDNSLCAGHSKGESQVVAVWNFVSNERVISFEDNAKRGSTPSCLTFVDDDSIAIAGYKNGVNVWNFRSGTMLFAFPGTIYAVVPNVVKNTLVVVASVMRGSDYRSVLQVISKDTGVNIGRAIDFGGVNINGIHCDSPMTILL
jgi:WD40 repeat protein